MRGVPPARAHRALRRATLVRPILLALIATAIAGSLAGGQGYDRDDKILDPEIDPNPFDPRAELRDYFRANLTGGWWANEPTYGLSMFRVLLHAPKGWRGNPVSVTANLCPDPGHKIWKGMGSFAVQAFHQDHAWPEVICYAPVGLR